MRIDDKLKIRSIVNEFVILMPSKNGDKSTRMLSLNSTSHFLWTNLVGKDFEAEDAVRLLCEKYDVTKEVAAPDVDKWIAQLREYGALL